jgi:hypothetical protein
VSVARTSEKRYAYRFVTEKDERKKQFGRSRRRWKGIARTNSFQGGDKWRAIAKRVIIYFRVPSNAGKFLSKRESIDLPRRALLQGLFMYLFIIYFRC